MSSKNPSTSSEGGDNKRVKLDYINKSDKFLFQLSTYSNQFGHIYTFRLKEMRRLLLDIVKEKWGKDIPIKRVSDLREESQEDCAMIGTFIKYQQYRPSILRDIAEENHLPPPPGRLNYASDNDKLIMEGELQRVRLYGKIDVQRVTTGIVCAVRGYVEGDGIYTVDEYLFYESGPQKPLRELNESPLLVLVSGLDMTSSHFFDTSLTNLSKWFNGKLDDNDLYIKGFKSSKIVRVIFIGNSIRSEPEKKKKNLLSRKAEYPDTVRMVENFDKWLSKTFNNDLNVDIMPGEHDPSNFMLPQQPMHNCMFPKSIQNDKFNNVTNPYEFELFDRLVIGTSGQNIKNIMKVSKLDDPLEVARCVIKWSHIAPTAPDTLACYPYVGKDPFIITECPHISFSGNMDEFQTEVYEGSNNRRTRLVLVPAFVKTQSVAVVDLNTLNCEEISFKNPIPLI